MRPGLQKVLLLNGCPIKAHTHTGVFTYTAEIKVGRSYAGITQGHQSECTNENDRGIHLNMSRQQVQQESEGNVNQTQPVHKVLREGLINQIHENTCVHWDDNAETVCYCG